MGIHCVLSARKLLLGPQSRHSKEISQSPCLLELLLQSGGQTNKHKPGVMSYGKGETDDREECGRANYFYELASLKGSFEQASEKKAEVTRVFISIPQRWES